MLCEDFSGVYRYWEYIGAFDTIRLWEMTQR